MSKDYVIRKDKEALTIKGDSFLNADEILKDDYPYILDAIEKEEYTMEETRGDYFKEILFEDKVVGFAVYETTTAGSLSLVQVYILPEFRGNKLFINEIFSIFKRGVEVFITQPTRNLVEILIHYDLAKKVSDTIVISAIAFEIPFFCMESSTNRDDIDSDNIYLSNIYALDICSTLILQEISTPGKCVIYYHMFLDNDDDSYDCYEKREEILNDEYFYNVKDLFLDNQKEFIETIFDLKEKLPVAEEGFEKMVGYEDYLSDFMKDMVENNIVSRKRAFEIKEQLTYEYDHGMVTDEAILTRLNFLVDDDVRELTNEEMIDYINSDDILCPYCNVSYNLSDRYCINCGYNLYYDDEMDIGDIAPFMDILTEEDEDKQFAKFFKLLLEDEAFRNSVLNSGKEGEEIKEFLELIDEDPELKKMMMDSLIDENYDEKVFLTDLNDEVSHKDKFNNFFNNHGYLNDDSNVNNASLYINDVEVNSEAIDINNLTEDDFLRLLGRKYSLNGSNGIYYDKQVFKILKCVEKYYNMELSYLGDKSMDHALTDFLLSQGYVSREVTKETWNDYAQDLTVPELKDILRINDLKVSGRKQELIDRIADADISFDGLFNEKDFLTDKGREFLKEYYWIDIYEKYLKFFEFDDFSRYLETHDGEFSEVAQNYLDENLKLAFESKNFNYLLDCFTAKSKLYEYFEDYENLCKSNLKIFCLGVNPIYYDEKVMGLPLSQSAVNSIFDLSHDLGKNKVLTIFDEAWDEMIFDDFIVDKKEARKILKDLLDNPDCDEYNDYLRDLLDEFNN